MLKIALDAGHAMTTPGKRCLKAIDPKQTREWYLNDRIADKLEYLLKGYNCEVRRTDDTSGKEDVPLKERVNIANAWEADVFISIHHDAGIGGKTGGGTTVYYCSSKSERAKQAQALYNAVTKETKLVGNRSSKVKKRDYYVIKNTDMPAFLIENGFMDSKTDTPIILTEDHATKTANGLLNFLIDTFNLKKLETKAEVKKDNSYLVKVLVDNLNVRAGAGTNYKVNTVVQKGQVFTIIATSGSWGKLMSGSGWINISSKYVKIL